MRKGLVVVTKAISNLPNIVLSDIHAEIETLLSTKKIHFVLMDEAPWWIRQFSKVYNEFYLSYKDTVYIPKAHVALIVSKEPNQRLISTSKVLPWVYAIKNGSVSSFYKFLQTIFIVEIRSYYFLFEFGFLKAHEVEDLPELIAVGFLSSRRNILGVKKSPDKVSNILKELLRTKIN